jgi:hypothetical protein
MPDKRTYAGNGMGGIHRNVTLAIAGVGNGGGETVTKL